jgi:8-oxo-dGTP pyrophosphatase MutT (NUDIX family)
MNTSAPVVVRPAATVIVLREHGGAVEVLMTLRHSNLQFMGGQWVFPGGAVAPSDASDAAVALVSQRDDFTCHRMRTLQGDALPVRQCLGLAVAACRETFEETGVLLASHVDGRPCDPQALLRVQAQRAQITKQPTLFLDVLAQEQLRLDLGRLIYWAHWITPSNSPRRFDTHFFAVAAPASHEVTADSGETTEYRWQTPAALIEAAEQQSMPISHPTQHNLRDLQSSLSRHGSLDALLRAESSRQVIPTLPKMYQDNGRTIIVMPWEADYAQAPGEGAPYPTAARE